MLTAVVDCCLIIELGTGIFHTPLPFVCSLRANFTKLHDDDDSVLLTVCQKEGRKRKEKEKTNLLIQRET